MRWSVKYYGHTYWFFCSYNQLWNEVRMIAGGEFVLMPMVSKQREPGHTVDECMKRFVEDTYLPMLEKIRERERCYR